MSLEPIDSTIEIKENFRALCRELNMDKETEESSWVNYSKILKKFNLDGDQYHWFCCSLYTACRETYTPTVGERNSIVRGNCVSLTKLLRNCNISIYDFFIKIKLWSEMTIVPKNFKKQIDRLEHNFSITFHLFQRYNNIFDQIFIVSQNEKRNRKSRLSKCSTSKLYDFCWYLFLCAKNEDSKYSVDVVTSFHLLLCCLDLVFVNALMENRTDLLNSNFDGVPTKWNTDEFNPRTTKSYCSIEKLCTLTEAVPIDVIKVKSSTWKAIIKEFINTKTLHGNSETFMDIISTANFERNLKSLSSAYEQYVLSVGEFDERILLNNASFRKSTSTTSCSDSNKDMSSTNNPYPQLLDRTLESGDSEEKESTAHSLKSLQNIGDLSEPSPYICQAGTVVVKKLQDEVKSMHSILSEKFPTKDEVEKYFHLAKSLYFYLLEKIIRIEIKVKPNLEPKILFEAEIFNKTLFACCIEIVLNAHSYPHTKFPWVLSCFEIKAFQFYKIIEIVVRRHEGILTRQLIKHLNMVEEVCLESLVWRGNSPLWETLLKYGIPLPAWMDVDIKNNINELVSTLDRNRKNTSFQKWFSLIISLLVIQSPVNSVYDCFNTSGPTARRGLFNDLEPVDKKNSGDNIALKDIRKISGSIPIFLRKFFKLAWFRIRDLCRGLDMGDEKYLNKIWTLFEYSITQRPELMKDRHLDQIIMCAIYLYIKVGEIQGKSFTDIMKYYRKQPQAISNTYREVLIESAKTEADGNERKAKYNDIIFFYNNIYVQKMTPYALKFSDKKQSQADLLLSPHPTEKTNVPTKLSNNHLLYVHPLEKNETLHSPNKVTYEFCKSPAKDLDKINEIVRKGGKRLLPFNEEVDKIVCKRVPHSLDKIHQIIKDRREKY